jgi:aryl sulfotransferase
MCRAGERRRNCPTSCSCTFSRLKRDLPGEIRHIAAFLDIPIDEARFPAIVEHCSFYWMKRHESKAAPLGGAFWEGGATTFIHKDFNGRWREVLSREESSAYELRSRTELGEHCAAWLAGNQARPAPRGPGTLEPPAIRQDALGIR